MTSLNLMSLTMLLKLGLDLAAAMSSNGRIVRLLGSDEDTSGLPTTNTNDELDLKDLETCDEWLLIRRIWTLLIRRI